MMNKSIKLSVSLGLAALIISYFYWPGSVDLKLTPITESVSVSHSPTIKAFAIDKLGSQHNQALAGQAQEHPEPFSINEDQIRVDARALEIMGKVDRLSSYDNDESTYTSQEYEEAIYLEMKKLLHSFEEVKESYESGLVSYEKSEQHIRELIENFVKRKQTLSKKRIDQSHKYRLSDLLAQYPELKQHYATHASDSDGYKKCGSDDSAAC